MSRWLYSTDARDIGILYLILSGFSGMLGTMMSLLIRLQLMDINQSAVLHMPNQVYNNIITVHALLMIFYLIMPALFGAFGNLFLPNLIGAIDMAFPRLNNVSFWLLNSSLILAVSSMILGEGLGTGWTFYPPLSGILYHSTISVDLGIFALHLAGISSMLGSINYVVTVLLLRAPGIDLVSLNLYVWSLVITAVLLILALPVLAGNLILPALKLAICWEHLIYLSQSAGNLYYLNDLGILRDYTPTLICLSTSFPIFISSKNMLGSYLAGLIEGDGTIIVPKTERSNKGKLNYPSIQIVFHAKDFPLALMIQKIFKYGSISKKKGSNAYILTINNKEGIILLINLINGYMRTPKINRLYLLIDWANNHYNVNIIKLNLDTSPLDSNAWFSGFIDADGHFSIRTTKNEKNTKIECKFELTQSKLNKFNEDTEGDQSFLLEIANFLESDVKLIRSDKEYRIRTLNLKSNLILVNYLTKYSLYSSKYNDYLDWLKVLEYFKLSKKVSLYYDDIIKIKQNMNNNRTIFIWDHLNNFYSI